MVGKREFGWNQRLSLGEVEIDSKEKKIIPDMVSQMLFPAE